MAGVVLLAVVGLSGGWRGVVGPGGESASLLQEGLHFQDVRYYAWTNGQVQNKVMGMETALHSMANASISLHALQAEVQASAATLDPVRVNSTLTHMLAQIYSASKHAAGNVQSVLAQALVPVPAQAAALQRTEAALERADARALGRASLSVGGFTTALARSEVGAARLATLVHSSAALEQEGKHAGRDFAGWVMRGLARPAAKVALEKQAEAVRSALDGNEVQEGGDVARVVRGVDSELADAERKLAGARRAIGGGLSAASGAAGEVDLVDGMR